MSSILILGASYGSLLATRLSMAGHDVCLVCTPGTADLINREGTRVRFPLKGRENLVEVDSRKLAGAIVAATPEEAQPAAFDLAVLAMQESQYGEAGVRNLMQRLALAGIPCVALMNMPPPPFLRRIPGLQVDLPTNFKCAPFASEAHTALLRQLAADIEKSRHEVDGESVELPVKLKVHDSLFVPMAKWPMLLTGNYRCIGDEGIVPIADAVHGDPALSRAVYEWVGELCCALGAQPDDLVPFEKYAAAAASLKKPSSAARSLAAGAQHIERVDLLVQSIAAQKGRSHPEVDAVVRRVQAALLRNREARVPVAA